MALRGPATDPDLRAAFEHLAQACQSLAELAARFHPGGDPLEQLRAMRPLTAKEAAPLVGEKVSYLERHGARLSYAEKRSAHKTRFLPLLIAAYLRGELPEFKDEEEKG